MPADKNEIKMKYFREFSQNIIKVKKIYIF